MGSYIKANFEEAILLSKMSISLFTSTILSYSISISQPAKSVFMEALDDDVKVSSSNSKVISRLRITKTVTV